jgi:hypothetical protein
MSKTNEAKRMSKTNEAKRMSKTNEQNDGGGADDLGGRESDLIGVLSTGSPTWISARKSKTPG